MLAAIVVAIAVTLSVAAICNALYVVERPTPVTGGSIVRFKSYIGEIGRDWWAKSILFGVFAGITNYFTGCGRWLAGQNFFFGLVVAIVIYAVALVPFVILFVWWLKQGTEWTEVLAFVPSLVIFLITAFAASHLLAAMLGLPGGSIIEAILTLIPLFLFGGNLLFYLGCVLKRELSKGSR